MGPCKNSAWFPWRMVNYNNSKSAVEFNLILFLPLISYKINIIWKLLALPSLTHNLQKDPSYEENWSRGGWEPAL